MGNVQSVECLDGQAAVGKTTYIINQRERQRQNEKNDSYCYLFSDPGGQHVGGDQASTMTMEKGRAFYFVKNDEEDLLDWRVCPLDSCQSGITHAFWMDLLLCLKTVGPNKRTVITDRSPLSHLVYEFWWKRLFPIITQEVDKDRSILLSDVDLSSNGAALIRKVVLGKERGVDSLKHFEKMVLDLMEEMNDFATAMGVKWTIHLFFSDSSDNPLHIKANERRNLRGGFDIFPLSPVEGDRTVLCDLLYCPGECLLWDTLFGVYQQICDRSRLLSLSVRRQRLSREGLLIDLVDGEKDAEDFLNDSGHLFVESD